MDSIIEVKAIRKIRPNLFLLDTGEVIGYGPRLAPTGLYFCFTCGNADCSHVATVDEDWLAGGHSVETNEAIPAAWWTVNGGADAMSIDRETGEVSYPEVTL